MHHSLSTDEPQQVVCHKYCILVQLKESKIIYLHKVFATNLFLFIVPLCTNSSKMVSDLLQKLE